MSATFCVVCMMLSGPVTGAEPAADENDKVQAVIDEVEQICKDGPVYMIGRKKAVRLAEMIREAKPELVVECGTALGYSGLWIGRELKAAGKGKLITIEISAERAKRAEAYFRRAGLDDVITVRVGDAREVVKTIKGPVGFLFVDCGSSYYYDCLKGIQPELRGGATIVADNAGISAGGMKNYMDEVRAKYKTHTEWFDIDLPWAKRDAMEVSIVPKKQ